MTALANTSDLGSEPAKRGGVLVVAEHRQGALRDVTREMITAGRGLGGPLAVAVIAADPGPLVEAVSLEGVDEVLIVRVEHQELENDTYHSALAALIASRQPDVALLGFTVDSMGYAPAVAAEMGLGFASDVFDIARDGQAIVATRAFYGGKVHAELELPPGPAIVLARPTVWPPAEGAGRPTVTEVPVPANPGRSRHRDYVDQPPSDVDITTADLLLSIGRGVGDKDNIETFRSLATQLGATLVSSRPLVDAGWMPASRQVGQSGKTVKPKVYLAMGISGAVQHLAGMKGSGTIIAVNTDPEAAIFEVAHYGAVSDIFAVAAELAQLF